MFLRKVLFETKAGERFLGWLERRTGLAIVESAWLGQQRYEARAAAAVSVLGQKGDDK